MNLSDLQTTWNGLGGTDPLWAILSEADKKGRRWDAGEFFATGVRAIEILMSELRSRGGTLGTRAALDFGCGVGRLTQPLTEYFDQVVGVDLSQEMVGLAQAHNRDPNHCRYVVNTTADLATFPTASFDLVLSYLTLQHIPPRYTTSYLHEFVRIARAGGIICVQLPAEPARLSAALRMPLWYTKNGMRALLRRFGLGPGARMSMYGVRRATVTNVLREAGARLDTIIPADDFTPGWRGYRYIAIKN